MTQRSETRIAARFLLASLAIKLVLLALDAQPRFFLGDSESYIATRLGAYVPRDRSWLYGMIAGPLLRLGHGFGLLITLQTVVGACVAASVGTFAFRRLDVSRRVAWGLVLGMSVEPFALYYERSILTETFGLALFWGSVVALVALAAQPSIPRAAALAASVVLAVALRTAFLPHALLVSVVCGWFALRAVGRWRAAAVYGLATVLLLLGLRGYAVVTGALVDAPPAVNPRSGAFLIGLFSPLLAPVDFDDLGLRDPAALLHATKSKERYQRNSQTFDPDGLFDRITHEVGDWRIANEVAGTAARRAMLRRPSGVAILAYANACEYANERMYHRQFAVDAGLWFPIPASTIEIVERRTGRPFDPAPALLPSLASRWLKTNLWAGRVVFLAALVLPLVLFPLAGWLVPQAVAPVRIVSVVSLGYAAAIALFSLVMAPRLLLPLVPCVVVLGTAGVAGAGRIARAARP